MLLLDFSSAFNTVISSKLVTNFTDLGINTSICRWILDFLISRHPSVSLGIHLSFTLKLTTGIQQDCVLSPLLYSLTIHDCVPLHIFEIIRYSDDTMLIGHISNNEELVYREEIQSLTAWCSANNLALSTEKAKERIMDFLKSKRSRHSPLYIRRSEVQHVSSTLKFFVCPHLCCRGTTTSLLPEETEESSSDSSDLYKCLAVYHWEHPDQHTVKVTVWYGSCTLCEEKKKNTEKGGETCPAQHWYTFPSCWTP